MKLSLLEICQNILNAMDSDKVNSIDDTEESLMVAEIVKEAYLYLMSKRDWPHLTELTTLEGVADVLRPTYMKIPDTINKVLWIKYNKKKVTYMEPEDFKDMIDTRTFQAGVVDANGYYISQDPVYWTSYDDQYIVFDGYLASTDSTLQASKSACYAVHEAEWVHEDDAIPDLPEKFFPTLVAEAKSASFLNLKQQANAKEEGKSKLGQLQMHMESRKNKKADHKTNTEINYGRK